MTINNYQLTITHKQKISIGWSGGKDSMLALDRIANSKKYHIDHLHTIVDKESRRVGMHGVSEKLIDQQAAALGIPLQKLYLEASQSHHTYEKLLNDYYAEIASEGIECVMFGDIYLEDLKSYREKLLLKQELKGVYPLWKMNTATVIDEFLTKGYKTKICAANAQYFTVSDMGISINKPFIAQLPTEVDVCGENGEFHSFVYDGPLFNYPLAVEGGEVVVKHYNFDKIDDKGKTIEIKSDYLFIELSIM